MSTKKMSKTKRMLVKQQVLIIFLLFCLSAIFGYFTLAIGRSYQGMIWTFFDRLFTAFVLATRSPWLTRVMMVISSVGKYGVITGWLVLIGYFLYRKRWALSVLILGMSVGGWGMSEYLKELVLRPRPEGFALVHEFSYSFPSSHAATSIIFLLTLSYFLYHFSRGFWRSFGMFVGAVLVAGTIGFSRIYLGVHYFSDVVAGYCLGLAYLFGLLMLFRIYCLISRHHC